MAILIVIAMCILSGAKASASTHQFLSSFDGSGTPAKTFGRADDVAVSGESGDVYVADVANEVVDRFDASGSYLGQITGGETPQGVFLLERSAAVAVDNSREGADGSVGDLYLLDRGNAVVDKFDASGKYITQIAGPFLASLNGLAVDARGDLWVDETGESPIVFEFDSNGVLLREFSLPVSPERGLAVSSVGTTYPVFAEGVGRVDASGTFLGLLEECTFCQSAIAADLSTDEIYVDDRTELNEYGPNGPPVIGQFGKSELGAGGSGGVGVNPITGVVYAADAAEAKVFVYGAEPGPRVLPEQATEIGPTTAALRAEVNPEGADTTYTFEYGTTLAYGSSAPAVATDAGSGTTFSSAEAQLEHLLGGTTYHFRVVASNSAGTVRGADRTFKTSPIAEITSAAATHLARESADLEVHVNLEGLPARYHFEWGTTAFYGHIAYGEVQQSEGDAVLLQHIEGLTEDTTYHWRVVVEDANGVTDGNDHQFRYEIPISGLPDNRAYEMVTPPRKNGALISDVTFLGASPTISGDGKRIFASTIQCFEDAISCTAQRDVVGSPYSFTRTSEGWKVNALAPPASELGAPVTWGDDASSGMVLFSSPLGPTNQDEFYGREADGEFVDLGSVTAAAAGPITPTVMGTFATPKFSKLIWMTTRSEWAFDPTNSELAFYEYDRSSAPHTQPTLVAVSGGRNSTDLIGVCGVFGEEGPYVVSNDGQIVYFTTAPCASGSGANENASVPVAEIFARVKGGEVGAHTVAISQPEAFQPAPPNLACITSECLENTSNSARFRGAMFEGSSRNGLKVFFASPQQLTDNASQDPNPNDKANGSNCQTTAGENGCNLYEYDAENKVGHQLIDVSAGDSSGAGPRVQGVLGSSPDGSHVYFVARGALTAVPNDAGQSATGGADNLYDFVRDETHPSGQVSFIASLPSSDSAEWSGPGQPANVTPDGRYLVFLSHGDLTVDDTSASGANQVFRYDAQEGRLARISVGDNGFNDNGNRARATPCATSFCSEDVRIPGGSRAPLGSEMRLDPTMSNDGAYVYFESPVALAPGALDDVEIATGEDGVPVYAQNVYEWHEGHTYLIASGDRTADKGQATRCVEVSSVCLLGSDESGANVFFSTTSQLTSRDTDSELDIYDARICTQAEPCLGPVARPVSCNESACHGAAALAPPAPSVASVIFSGTGNLSGQSFVQSKVKVTGRTVKHGRARLIVTVPAKGVVTINGPGIVSVTRSVPRKGVYRVSVEFSAAEQRAVRRRHGHIVRVGMTVRYKAADSGSTASAFIRVTARG